MGNVIRELFIGIDTIVFGLIEQIFQLIINLANFDLFSSKVLNDFSRRIYLILGLVMVFKLIIAFIKILIDPDKIFDKENGIGNILKRVAISMLLIVLVPTIFSEAKKLQDFVLPVIPKVILAVPADVSSENVDTDATATTNKQDEEGNVLVSTGRLMAYYSFLPFFYYSDEACNNGHLSGTGDDSQAEIYSVTDAAKEVNDKSCAESPNGYRYNYRYFMSTIVGAYLIYVLVTVALKVAIRTIKFGICQLIAPIPIASYIDPGTSKKAFDNWVNTSVKVYLDLFVRVIIVYFVIYIFSILFDGGKVQYIFENYDTFQALLILLFIIVGLLNFAKEMPKFVTGMLGVSDNFSDIGDMFKGGPWRSAAGVADIMRSNYVTQKERLEYQGKNHARLRALGSAFAGAGSYTARNLKAQAQGKHGADAYNAAFQGAVKKRDARIYNEDVVFANKENYSRSDYRRDKARERLSIPSAEQSYINRSSKYGSLLSDVASIVEYGNSKKEERRGKIFTNVASFTDPNRKMSLEELRKVSEREAGKYYSDIGRKWTEADSAYYSQAVSDNEKRLKYQEAEFRIHDNDSVALTKLQTMQRNLRVSANMFNDTIVDGAGNKRLVRDVFLEKVNHDAHTSYSLDAAGISQFLKDVGDSSKVDADLLTGLKGGFELLDMLGREEAAAAESRKKAFNQAGSNDKP